MSEFDVVFGELRSLLHGPPGKSAWHELVFFCDKLYDLDADRFTSRALGYAVSALERWPSEVRVAPTSWLEEGTRPGACPRLRLASYARIARCSPRDALALLSRPECQGLRGIELHVGPLTAGLMLALDERGFLAQLEHLVLGRGSLDATALAALTKVAAPALETLGLAGNDIGDDGAALLAARAAVGPKLRSLNVVDCGIGCEGLRELQDRGRLAHLRRLSAGQLTSERDLFRALEQRDLPSLQELHMVHSRYSSTSALDVAAEEFAGQLRVLTLRGEAHHVAYGSLIGPDFGALEELILSRASDYATCVVEPFAVQLLRGNTMPKLRRLAMSLERLNGGVAEALCAARFGPQLEHLGLHCRKRPDRAFLKTLERKGRFPALERLDLGRKLDEGTLRRLVTMRGLPQPMRNVWQTSLES